jgi:hypothetical protein
MGRGTIHVSHYVNILETNDEHEFVMVANGVQIITIAV